MKLIKVLMLGMLIVGTSTLTGCKKEGCTDPNGMNYNTKAKKDDGTCNYQGEVVIWFGEDTSNDLQLNGATTLTYYVDDNVVGSSATNVFWTGAPNCGQNASITIIKDLGAATNKSFTYRVQDQLGIDRWSGILNFSANTCEAVELVY